MGKNNGDKLKDKSIEISEIAQRIIDKINLIDELAGGLEDAGNQKAITLAALKRRTSINTIKLRNGQYGTVTDPDTGEVFQVDLKLPANLIPKVAEGESWKEQLEFTQAESHYKSKVVMMEAARAQLNGYQSIFKVLQ